MSNIYIFTGSIFKSSNRGLNWSNIGAPGAITSIVPYHDKIFISTAYDGIYKYDPTLPIYIGNNYFPLHLGNIYQYFESASNYYFTYYDIDIQLFPGKQLLIVIPDFNYSGWMRYSEGDKKIYKFDSSDLVS